MSFVDMISQFKTRRPSYDTFAAPTLLYSVLRFASVLTASSTRSLSLQQQIYSFSTCLPGHLVQHNQATRGLHPVSSRTKRVRVWVSVWRGLRCTSFASLAPVSSASTSRRCFRPTTSHGLQLNSHQGGSLRMLTNEGSMHCGAVMRILICASKHGFPLCTWNRPFLRSDTDRLHPGFLKGVRLTLISRQRWIPTTYQNAS